MQMLLLVYIHECNYHGPSAVSAGTELRLGTCKHDFATMLPAVAVLWLVTALVTGVPAELVPRITFQHGDPSRSVNVFTQPSVQNYDQFQLSGDQETLYVGARDRILALSTKDPINVQLLREIYWPPDEGQISNCKTKARKETECFNFIRLLLPVNDTHLYTCGTNAFSPHCTYIDLNTFSLPTNHMNETVVTDGKGRSPFDPRHKRTSVMAEGELYTGTSYNFLGNDPVILRTLGNKTSLKTEASLGWLHSDASFVGSFYIPGSESDGKVYFFFEETAKEFDFFDKLTVSRVARVCKNDVGGDKVLQRKWTTFLKAQLVCSHRNNFPFNVLRHVAFLYPGDPQKSTFYGVFSSQWQVGGSSSSAVCSFKLKDIETVFNGNYKEQNKESSKWTRYTGPVSNPRPGSCSSGKFSDTDLNFMKDHFLMDDQVSPVGKDPVLIKQSVSYTQIAIDSVQALHGTYTVMYLGTGTGSLHKAVLVKDGTESHIIEELDLLPNSEPIETLQLVPSKEILYVGSTAGILQIPLANCSVYRTCFECILARDPYCAWNLQSRECQSTPKDGNLAFWLQDIETGNPNSTCLSPTSKLRSTRPGPDTDNPPMRAENYTASYNTILKLQCPELSSLATYSWKRLGQATEKQMVTSKETLIVIVRSDTLGLYECWANENGFKYKVAQYWVKDPNGVDVSHRGTGDGNFGLENDLSFSSHEQNYYKPFVAVTVLLTLTLCGGLFLTLYTCRDRIKVKSKIQGCSTPETEKLSASKQPDKTPLNGLYQNVGNFAQPCCPMGRANGNMDVDNNSVNMMPNGAMEGAADV
ncbi:semaphorin-4A isoform X2 [Pseudophryne corroboree]|uniref:semaphorin-4A isoform X2 n=1 Tax=Pseudophryne corroboree TaxID=495146 RepID=UPI0030819D31